MLGEAGAARIKSGDYASWDRYDVDGILREMDHETHDTSGDYTSGGKSAGKSAGESAVQSAESENVSVEAAEARRAEALRHKDLGNGSFKAGRWGAAVDAYSRSLALDAANAVVYTNRAMAYLKLEQ